MSVAAELTRIQGAKADLKTAIEAKGVTVSSSTTIDGYAPLVSSIFTDGLPPYLKNGDTHLWLWLATDSQLAQQIRIQMVGTIDWGDGTTTTANSTTYTTYTHTYSATGYYRIDLKPTAGTILYLGGASSSYCVMGGVANNTNDNFNYRQRLALYQVEIGENCIDRISNYAFLKCIGLLRVYIPDNVKMIGTQAFYYCKSLIELEFEDPSTMTGNTTFNTTFSDCNCLRTIDGLTSATVATMSVTYRYCWSLEDIIIPASVTNIAANTFNQCYGLKYLHCLPTTPPTVATESAFTNMNANCIIEVPSASLAAYQTASIWSSRASQMVGV